MYNKLFHVELCQHCDGHVDNFEVQVVSDSEESAKELIKLFYGTDEPNESRIITTFCIRYVGECEPQELETLIADDDIGYGYGDEPYELTEEEDEEV